MEEWDNCKKIIGDNISTARRIRGLSQRALAAKIGVAFQNLSAWERGKVSPSAKYLINLSEILDLSLDQLTSESGISAIAERALSNYSDKSNQDKYKLQPSTVKLDSSNAMGGNSEKSISGEISTSVTIRKILQSCEEILQLIGGQVGKNF